MTDIILSSRAAARFDVPIDVEDVPEFHVARILVLMAVCGEGRTGLIRGRTKLAKLDFFVRYPRYLQRAVERLRQSDPSLPPYSAGAEGVEASMVRYHFGPWDHRYFEYLAMLGARGLVRVGGSHRSATYSLTGAGRQVAEELRRQAVYRPVVERCEVAARAFAGMHGTDLKNFVYETFQEEVTNLPRNAVIADIEHDAR